MRRKITREFPGGPSGDTPCLELEGSRTFSPNRSFRFEGSGGLHIDLVELSRDFFKSSMSPPAHGPGLSQFRPVPAMSVITTTRVVRRCQPKPLQSRERLGAYHVSEDANSGGAPEWALATRGPRYRVSFTRLYEPCPHTDLRRVQVRSGQREMLADVNS